ncbi:MAG: PqiC family protein [Thermodesulfovibrionales bacterium]|nr:PqiC family protein [Thermodesulfovibrionales bacterium]
MKKLFIALVSLIFISCSFTETKIYSLYLPTIDNNLPSQKQRETLYLSVRTPRYLDQPYIIFRDSPYELNLSSYAKWDASPSDIMKQNIVEVLTSKKVYKEVKVSRPQVNEKAEVMIVDLKDFSRYDEGQFSYGMLQFSVLLRDKDNKEVYRKEFKIKEKLDDKTYLSLAKGMSKALINSLNVIVVDISNP